MKGIMLDDILLSNFLLLNVFGQVQNIATYSITQKLVSKQRLTETFLLRR